MEMVRASLRLKKRAMANVSSVHQRTCKWGVRDESTDQGKVEARLK